MIGDYIMKTLTRYTQEEAQAIIAANEQMQREFADLHEYFGALDHGFDYGNFFNCEDLKENQVCIQWCGDNIGEFHEVVVDSLEELVVALNEIEAACGNICVK